VRIKKIRLKNVGPHAELCWSMSPGVVGILGPNGSGKSTAVNAAYAATTNDYSRFEGGKQGCIRQQAAEGEAAFIEVTLEHLEETYIVFRGLRPDKHEFYRVGDSKDKMLTKAGEIADFMEVALGITRPILDNYVFVAQWDMFAFLSITATERAKHFAKLCGTTLAEVRWNRLGKQVELDRALAAEIVDDSDEIRKQLSRARTRAEDLEASLARAEKAKESKSEVNALRKVGEARRQYQKVSKELPTARQEEHDCLQTAKQAARDVKTGEARLQERQTALRKSQDSVDAQAEQLAGLNEALKNHRLRARLRRELQELKNDARGPVERSWVLDGSSEKEIRARASQTAKAHTDVLELLEAVGGDVAECPTCGTPTDSEVLVDKLAEARAALPGLVENESKWAERLSLLEDYQREVHQYEVWHAGYKAEVKRLQARIGELVSVDLDETKAKIASAEAVVETRNTFRERSKKAADRLPKLRKLKEEAIAAHVLAKRELAALEEQARHVVSAEEAEKAEERLQAHEAAVAESAGAASRLDEVKESCKSLSLQLKRLRRAMSRAKKGRKWIAFLESARKALHRDNLPAEVHRAILGEMEHGINVDLERIGAPFYICSTEGLSFTAFFQEGVVMPAGGLSGGQKVVLALPFLLQVNSLFAAQVGMLVLDEPTAGLDATYVDSMIEVFDRLRGMAKAQGFQIFVITHETELERAFDQVFVVGNATQ
jgi:DNA repair exonuclease SbcCD ATPase subunit